MKGSGRPFIGPTRPCRGLGKGKVATSPCSSLLEPKDMGESL